MKKRSEEFVNNLYEEKLKHKEHRTNFVLRKLLFTVGLFSFGSVKFENINMDLLLYCIPFVMLAHDVYIFAEDYKVKRIGVFIRNKCTTSCDDEKKWEEWVDKFREPLAAKASSVITLIAFVASAAILLTRNYNKIYYVTWASLCIVANIIVICYALWLKRELNKAIKE